MKTITELNTKIWYRSLKVIYLIFVIWVFSIVVMGNIVLFNTIKENKTEYSKAKDKETQRVNLINELKNNGSSTDEIYDVLGRHNINSDLNDIGFTTLSGVEFKALYGEEEFKKFGDTKTVILKPESSAAMRWLLASILLSGLIIWLVAQIPKWIFYYIVLGKIRPNK